MSVNSWLLGPTLENADVGSYVKYPIMTNIHRVAHKLALTSCQATEEKCPVLWEHQETWPSCFTILREVLRGMQRFRKLTKYLKIFSYIQITSLSVMTYITMLYRLCTWQSGDVLLAGHTGCRKGSQGQWFPEKKQPPRSSWRLRLQWWMWWVNNKTFHIFFPNGQCWHCTCET